MIYMIRKWLKRSFGEPKGRVERKGKKFKYQLGLSIKPLVLAVKLSDEHGLSFYS